MKRVFVSLAAATILTPLALAMPELVTTSASPDGGVFVVLALIGLAGGGAAMLVLPAIILLVGAYPTSVVTRPFLWSLSALPVGAAVGWLFGSTFYGLIFAAFAALAFWLQMRLRPVPQTS